MGYIMTTTRDVDENCPYVFTMVFLESRLYIRKILISGRCQTRHKLLSSRFYASEKGGVRDYLSLSVSPTSEFQTVWEIVPSF